MASIFVAVVAALALTSVVADKPNILFIIADDLGFADIGYRSDYVVSPNIDELATSGVILDYNYVQPACTPSRHAFLSGRYPFRSKMMHGVIGDQCAHCSPTDLTFLPQRLKELDYNTYLVGKWHLGFCQEGCLPWNRGFDHFYGCLGGAEDFYTHSHGGGYDWYNEDQIDESVKGVYHTDVVNDYVIDFLDTYDSEDPFYMYLSYTNVHTPHAAPQKYIDAYADSDLTEENKVYLALMTAMDESIGNIVEKLKDTGLYDNTLIVFTADNGGEAFTTASNSPLRGAKTALWEGGCRVNGFVSGPLLTKSGYVHEGLFHAVDWVPTLVSMAGGSVDDTMDGMDQTDMLLNGADSPRTEIIYNIDMERMPYFGQAAIRQGDLKLIWGLEGFVDGYGQDMVFYYDNPENLALIGVDPASIKKRDLEKRGEVSFTQAEIQRMGAICGAKGFDSSDITSGHVRLYDLSVDESESNDLSGDPDYAQNILDLKQRILDLLAEYNPAPSFVAPICAAREEALPENFGGNWATGWCEDVTITMDS